MNTLNYIGCKKTLLNYIRKAVLEYIGSSKNEIRFSERKFADLFAGTGIVGGSLASMFGVVEANDLEYYSYTINCALLKCPYTEKLALFIEKLNALEGIEGIISKHYSPTEGCERLFFTVENAMKCDAMRQQIEIWLQEERIDVHEYAFLVASVLVSIDKVANTTSVYGAYLKKFKKSALKPLVCQPIHTFAELEVEDNEVHQGKTEELVKSKTFDIVYMDPPYNQRQYGANYAPLNYIAYYDETIKVLGKTGLIKDYNKSDFCSKRKVKECFRSTLEDLKCKCLILSYNNEGLLNIEELKEILLQKGQVILYRIKYNKFKAHQRVDKKYVEEYLWVVDTEGEVGVFEERSAF